MVNEWVPKQNYEIRNNCIKLNLNKKGKRIPTQLFVIS